MIRPLLVLLALTTAFVLACSGSPPGVRDISPDDLMARAQDADVLILDVRTSTEYETGHVPGAINIPFDEVEARLDELEPHRDGEIVLYCESGRRAGKAGDVLTGAGFEGIHHLEGDMSGWRKAGRPTEH